MEDGTGLSTITKDPTMLSKGWGKHPPTRARPGLFLEKQHLSLTAHSTTTSSFLSPSSRSNKTTDTARQSMLDNQCPSIWTPPLAASCPPATIRRTVQTVQPPYTRSAPPRKAPPALAVFGGEPAQPPTFLGYGAGGRCMCLWKHWPGVL